MVLNPNANIYAAYQGVMDWANVIIFLFKVIMKKVN